MKTIVLFLSLFLAGCETLTNIYSSMFGEDEQCIQLENGAFVIYSPDGEVIDCVETVKVDGN